MNLNSVAIGDVCELFTGGTPDKKNEAFYEGGDVPWLVSGDIHNPTITTCEGRITEVGLQNSAAKYLPEGSVLIALNGQGKTRGTVARLKMAATCNQSLVAIHPKDSNQLHSNFLFHNLKARYQEIRQMTGSQGNDRRGLNMGLIKDIKIPLPPLDEQKRIAGILDQADALRRLRTRALDKLDTLGQAIFHEMFGDPILNERGWRAVSIDAAKITISDGNYAEKYPKASDFVDDGVPFIRANNIKDGTVVADDLRYISNEKHELLQKGHLREGDVLITTRGKIGNLAVVPARFHDANINAQLVLMRCLDTIIQPEFLYYQLSQQSFQLRFEKIQTGVALKQLPVKRLKQLEIILPPSELQNDFTEKMQRILMQRESAKRHNRDLSSLFSSLQDRAFRGEL